MSSITAVGWEAASEVVFFFTYCSTCIKKTHLMPNGILGTAQLTGEFYFYFVKRNKGAVLCDALNRSARIAITHVTTTIITAAVGGGEEREIKKRRLRANSS